jgi:putative chitinase
VKPLTVEEVREIEPRARSGLVGPTVTAINRYAAQYHIDTPLRLAHFLAQIIHESAGLTTFEELGGRRYFAKYEGTTSLGKSLGNTQPGDGYRYRGRGPIQCTGRANYRFYGGKLGLDLVGDPESAAEPDVGVRIALEYWTAHALNSWADRDDCRQITKRINGGLNGLSDREHYVTLAKDVLGVSDNASSLQLMLPLSDTEIVPSAAIAEDPPKGMLSSREGWGAISIGGMSLAEIGTTVQDYATENLSLDGVLALVRAHPRLLMLAAIVGISVLIWVWRHQRMHE